MMMAPPIAKPRSAAMAKAQAPSRPKARPIAPNAPRLFRKCACDDKAPGAGTCADKQDGLRRRLSIGPGNDPLERAADGTADQVPADRPQADFSMIPVGVQRHAPQQTGPALEAPAHGIAGSLQRKLVDSDVHGESAAVDSGRESADDGIEINPRELMMFPRSVLMLTPAAADQTPSLGKSKSQPKGSAKPKLCDKPEKMVKVTSGKFQGKMTLDDYYPDLVGTNSWGAKDTAGPFDNGKRAGSAVQLIGYLPASCNGSTSTATLAQQATVVRARVNGKKAKVDGKDLEGQTFDDIALASRDQSKAPFRQTWGRAISMADPISGVPYFKLDSYENETNLKSSLIGAGGTVSVTWGITTEASKGKVTKNELR